MVSIAFSGEINEWRLRRANRDNDSRKAINGAIVHAPFDVTGEVVSIKRYGPNPRKWKVLIQDDFGVTHERIVDPNVNVKPYNVQDSLIDTKRMMWLINVDDNGVAHDQFFGVNFMPQAIDQQLGQLEARALSAEHRLKTFLTSPLDDTAFAQRAELLGHVRKLTSEEKPQPAKAPLVEVTTSKDDENEDG